MGRALFLGVLVTACLGSGSAVAAKDYYKWTDDEGVTHYSARKPHDRDAEVISVSTGESTHIPARPAAAGTSPRPETRGQEPTTSELRKDPERCKVARGNLEVLRTSAKVRMRGEDGEIHYLSEEEKAQRVREFEQAAAESC